MIPRFDPLWPHLCFIAAVVAVPLGLAVRKLGGATRGRLLPAGWTGVHLLVFSAALTGAFTLVLFSASLLELAVARLNAAPGAAPAAAVAHAIGQLLAHLGWGAWQGLLLLLPIAAALAALAELRWPRRPLHALAQMSTWPLWATALGALVPAEAHSLRALALALVPALTWAAARQIGQLPARWRHWRAQAPTPSTRVSSLPAAMAAALHSPPRPRLGVTTPMPRPNPLPRPALPRTEITVAPTVLTRWPGARAEDRD